MLGIGATTLTTPTTPPADGVESADLGGERDVTEDAVRATALRKSYRDWASGGRRRLVIDDLSLTIERRGIHGLLGAHESGLSTLLALLLGTTRPDSGDLSVLGEKPSRSHRFGRIGAQLADPGLLENLSARRNLELIGGLGGLNASTADAVLHRVGLAAGSRAKVRQLSLLQRRRLELAVAVIGEPELVLLDDPTRGLDPESARELRSLISTLAEQGTTVILGSHSVADIQQLCDSVTILRQGKALASGPVAGLLGERASLTRLQVGDPTRAVEVLTAAGFTARLGDRDVVVQGHDRPAEVTRTLAEHGLYVSEISADRPTLEEVVVRLSEPTSEVSAS